MAADVTQDSSPNCEHVDVLLARELCKRDAGLGRDRVTERRACHVLDQPRSTQRSCRQVPCDEPRLV